MSIYGFGQQRNLFFSSGEGCSSLGLILGAWVELVELRLKNLLAQVKVVILAGSKAWNENIKMWIFPTGAVVAVYNGSHMSETIP